MKKTNLVLFPVLAALLLAGCTTTKKSSKKKKSSEAQTSQKTTSQGGGGNTSQGGGGNTSQGGQSATPTPTGNTSFVLTAGTHTVTLDFENNISDYSSGFPRAEQTDTAGKEGTWGGMTWDMFHTYKGSYESDVWLMMKDKDNWDATSNAWFANKQSLGSIEKLDVYVRVGASANKKYDLSVGDSAFSSAQTGGTEFNVSTVGSYTGSGKGFFCISTKKDTGTNKYNGQIAKIVVTYTIS